MRRHIAYSTGLLLLLCTLMTRVGTGEVVSEPARQILVTHRADVVVVGAGNTGGLAGCFAAIAAARNGASVVLVEEGGYVGLHVPLGLGVVIGIHDWRPGMDEGLFRDFAGYVAKEGQWSYTPMTEQQLREKTEIIIRHHDVVSTAMLAVLKDAGVTTLFHTKFSRAIVDDNHRMTAIVVESPQGRHAIAGKAFVDNTGLGDVAASAGAPMLREEAFMGVQAFIGKVDTRKYNEWVEKNKQPPLDESYKKWMEGLVGPFKELKYPWDQWWPEYLDSGRTPAPVVRQLREAQEKGEFTLLHRRGSGILAIAEGVKATEDVAMPRTYVTGLDPTNVDDVSWVELTSRLALLEYHRVLKARIPGFENSVMERLADIVGLRGGRHIQLEKQLSSAEIEGGGTNPDCIYISRRGKDRKEFEVPYRVLLPQKVEGLLVCGKAAGAAISLRPANSILFQGQAAGTAAAIAAKAGITPREVDIGKLQDALRAGGVKIPEHPKAATDASAGVLRTQSFDRDPKWDGRNNRIAQTREPRQVRQDFGYSPTAHVDASHKGEIGGYISPAAEPAYYGKAIAEHTLDKPFSASGKFVVPPGGGNTLIGFFNKDTINEWRTPNTLGMRVNGRGENFHAYAEYCTSKWRAGGYFFSDVDLPTARKERKGIPSGDAVHSWSIKYDPTGNKGGGTMLVKLDSDEVTVNLDPGHKSDGAAFNRFGILNVLKAADGGGTVWIGDLQIDGERQSFDADPQWEQHDNRRTYATRNVRPAFDFGYSHTRFAGGFAIGEIGGTIYRGDERYPDRMAYYGDVLATDLSFEDPLEARGKIVLRRACTDAGVLFGFFHATDSCQLSQAQKTSFPENFLGVSVEGPSSEGFLFYPVYGTSHDSETAACDRQTDPPHIYPDGKPHDWTLRYDPTANHGRGRITITLDGKPAVLDLREEHRKMGAHFNRFGFVTTHVDGNSHDVYLDDLTYTVGRK